MEMQCMICACTCTCVLWHTNWYTGWCKTNIMYSKELFIEHSCSFNLLMQAEITHWHWKLPTNHILLICQQFLLAEPTSMYVHVHVYWLNNYIHSLADWYVASKDSRKGSWLIEETNGPKTSNQETRWIQTKKQCVHQSYNNNKIGISPSVNPVCTVMWYVHVHVWTETHMQVMQSHRMYKDYFVAWLIRCRLLILAVFISSCCVICTTDSVQQYAPVHGAVGGGPGELQPARGRTAEHRPLPGQLHRRRLPGLRRGHLGGNLDRRFEVLQSQALPKVLIARYARPTGANTVWKC